MPGVIVNVAIRLILFSSVFAEPYRRRTSRPDGEFLPLLLRPFQHLLDAGGISGLNQLFQFTE